MQKTIVEYKKIEKSQSKIIPQLWIDLWIMCWVDNEYFYFYRKITKTIEKKLTLNEEAFEKFWDKYPRKVSKKKSEQIFMGIDPKLYDNLFAWLETYLKSWKKYVVTKNFDFIPHPTTWLNQERWTDEVILSAESQTLINIERAKKEAEEDKKKEALAKFEANELKKKVDDKILELQNNDSGRYERILEYARNKVLEQTPDLRPDLMQKSIDIALRVKIKELYFK